MDKITIVDFGLHYIVAISVHSGIRCIDRENKGKLNDMTESKPYTATPSNRFVDFDFC